MKIIEALKKVKDLTRKASDLQQKISEHCAIMDYETPTYADQESQIKEWLQAHGDIILEIEKLRIAIQKTNLATDVTIEIGDNKITKSIASWIHRRKDLSQLDLSCWRRLTDRNLKEGSLNQSNGLVKEVKIKRFYDPKTRDNKLATYLSEPSQIDATLEVINAVTDLI